MKKENYQNEYSGHDFFHTLRVYKLASKIAEIENANAVSKNANAYMARMEYMSKNNSLSTAAIQTLYNQKQILSELNNAYNAGMLAVQMLAVGDKELKAKLVQYRKEMKEKFIAENGEGVDL